MIISESSNLEFWVFWIGVFLAWSWSCIGEQNFLYRLVISCGIIYPGLSSHRYSVIFCADSEIFAFSAMFRAEPADFNFDISGHNWFSDEHFWTSLIQRWTLLAGSKQANTMKKAKTSGFFSILMLKRREIENFRITFDGLIWKILKMWFFRNLYFLLIPWQKTSY